jgi:murein DD-endopeptidase MepM/ murein hydrolase activator NlpD
VILLLAWLIRSVDTPVTQYLSDKASDMLSSNIEISKVYEAIDNAISNLFNKESGQKEEEAVTASSEAYEYEVYDTGDISGCYFIIPVEGTPGSPFGDRINPVTKKEEMHKGIDIGAKIGDSIFASMDGEIETAEMDSTYGNYIKISHEGGFETLYAHCSELLVKKGQTVYQGDVIAKVGNTGLSDGPHLHFEIIKDGTPVNPQDFLLFE